MWVQQLNKIGLMSMNKLGTLENVADMMTKHCHEEFSTNWQE